MDNKFKIFAFFLSLLLFNHYAVENENIIGLYRSNFTSYGFFASSLKLDKDSTFHYHFGGDLIDNDLYGTWYLSKDTIKLNNCKIDTTKILFAQSMDSSLLKTLSNKFFIRGQKIYFIDKNNRIIKRVNGYHSRIIEFLSFGKIYYIKKKSFLLKKN
jgi:hypothetical protein